MSTYRDKAIHPKTGRVGDADWLDNYFGRHQYGVRFDGEVHVYRRDEVRLPPETASGAEEYEEALKACRERGITDPFPKRESAA